MSSDRSPTPEESRDQEPISLELEQEWADVVFGFEDIQAELNYQQAQTALADLLARLHLTPREQVGLEAEVQGLRSTLEKLDRMVVQIAVFGMVGRGKSSLLNALLGETVFETGAVHGVTQAVQSARWQLTRQPIADSQQDILRVSLRGTGDSQVELIDTPGIDEVYGEYRERLARQIARQADLILFVIAGDMTRVEYDALLELRQASKPILIVLNKVDQYSTSDREAIYLKLRDQRLRSLISPDEIVMAAAAPLVTKAVRHADGQLSVQTERGHPQVIDLKLKILEVLQREGKALVALNSLLYADEVSEQILTQKRLIRDRSASDLIWSAVMTKAIAIAINPVVVIDLLGGVAIDIAMIVALSKLYGVPMTQKDAIGLLRKIAVAMGGITAGELLATLGLGSLKGLLGLAIPMTGGLSLAPYVPIALTQAAISGVSSYGIGQVAKAYLANGASWGVAGAKPVIQQILDSLDEESILSRIREELQVKLGV